MANQWYYTKGEERVGPVSSDDLKQLAASGELKPDDLIWKDGLEDWKPASQLKGLYPDSPVDAATPERKPGVSGGHPLFWQIPLMVAALILISAMFLPWWSFQVKGKPDEFEDQFFESKVDEEPVVIKAVQLGVRPRRRPGRKKLDKDKAKTFAKNMTSSVGWYLRNLDAVSLKSNLSDVIESEGKDNDIDVKGKIWGWHTNLGLGAGFFGFAILPLSLVMMVSASVRRFSFVFSFLAAYVSFVLMVLSALWWLDTPGWDMKPIVTQGAHVGPYLVMGGGLLILIFGLLDGILGLRAFSRTRND